MQIEILLTPAEIANLPRCRLHEATCVVFDVLRATSTMLTALAQGARRIYPVTTVAEARELRRTRLPGALLGGERGGVRIEGLDLGNSPREYTREVVSDREVIMTTTNGTVALQACAAASVVYAGALLNLEAQATAIERQMPRPKRLLLVCAGSGAEFALEDGLAAAALLFRLRASEPLADASMLLETLHRAAGEHPLSVLRSSSNGRRLLEIGLAADVEYCARVSVLDSVGLLREGALERLTSA